MKTIFWSKFWSKKQSYIFRVLLNLVNYIYIFWICGRGSFVRFVDVRVGVTTWVNGQYVCIICMHNLYLLAFIVPETSTFIRTDGHGQIDSAVDPDLYTYMVGNASFCLLHTCVGRFSSACYILFNECSIPFYSRNNGYKYAKLISWGTTCGQKHLRIDVY